MSQTPCEPAVAGCEQTRAIGAERDVAHRRLVSILPTSRRPPSLTCQTEALPSPAPTAIFRPSGLNARQKSSVLSRWGDPKGAPSSAFQTRTVPLNPPETIRRPSGLNRASRSRRSMSQPAGRGGLAVGGIPDPDRPVVGSSQETGPVAAKLDPVDRSVVRRAVARSRRRCQHPRSGPCGRPRQWRAAGQPGREQPRGSSPDARRSDRGQGFA